MSQHFTTGINKTRIGSDSQNPDRIGFIKTGSDCKLRLVNKLCMLTLRSIGGNSGNSIKTIMALFYIIQSSSEICLSMRHISLRERVEIA